jgi:hypothetical protein
MDKFPKRKAVLVSGGIDRFQNHARYLNDLVICYRCLVDRYDFLPSDIQVIYNNGGWYDMGRDTKGASSPVLTQWASKQNVLDALDKTLGALGSDDFCVLFTTNHGSDASGRLELWTPSEYLTPNEFGTALAKHKDQYRLGIFGHCYGEMMIGPLLKNTAADKAVGVAASKTASYALPPDDLYDAFIYHYISALAEQTPAGYPVESDSKGDGVDVKEAYDFATTLKSYTDWQAVGAIKDQPDIQDNSKGPSLMSRLTLHGLI